MRVLVTGATGFIGSALCGELCRLGHTVAAFHRPTSTINNISSFSLTRLVGDLTDEDSVMQAVTSFHPQVIYHLGAQMNAAPTVNRIMQVNVLGTRAVLLAALRNGVDRVVLMSSAAALGLPDAYYHNEDRSPASINESRVQAAESDLWPFAKSKYLAEMEAQSAATGGLDTVIVNPFMVIGPGDWYRRKSSLLLQMKTEQPKMMVRGGINVISIQDTVTGLINACRYGKSGERYLLCGENVTYQHFFEMCGSIAGFESPRLLFENETLSRIMVKFGVGQNLHIECLEGSIYAYPNRYFYYDPKKSRVALHLPPLSDLETTIRDTYRWFEENI